ncbi:N5-carboxyaminoimidazole ribonucleotide synthase [Roseimaritima multifibrata]|uniref:N5-carboxyaminoimidazole ribonucleotide synthase n=1 Tax=Roseimaritima multifibrata TaxID=1930274 RepID=A0A517MES4_9BACT|nr:5-(carboxyamino)imidazole ribonucleotide synthase [Roseimaritima multifibrata]QDS93267.1 N5-carboxyaminoimidazole ribonucleotide synthase [Roseimaritima multifibrata]
MLNAKTDPDSALNPKTIRPGATIGMLGGGQLGRMFFLAAKQMGYHAVVLTDSEGSPAALVADSVIVGDYTPQNLEKLASQCDVVTLEFENIPDAAVQHLAKRVPTFPPASILRIAQDRHLEKRTLAEMPLPVTPFRTVEHPGSEAGIKELSEAAAAFGFPLILKTARSGYDGKGQKKVANQEELIAAANEFGNERIVAEKMIAFEREVSVLVARNQQGETAVYPLIENQHRNHILAISHSPAAASPEIEKAAVQIAETVAKKLDLVGILCVELFEVPGEGLIINEIAPRPHNSGHLTIEGSSTSQFEQHVRAVCGLPLGDTSPRCPAAMFNLLGDLWGDDGSDPPFEQALTVPGVSLHLYGKTEARPGRKMGHLTAVGKTVEEALRRVYEAYELLVE